MSREDEVSFSIVFVHLRSGNREIQEIPEVIGSERDNEIDRIT